MPCSRSPRLVLALLVLLGPVARVLAQDSEPAAPVSTLTVTTRLVLLDTNVVDAQGKPVEGLTAKDFAVYEDGKQQRIASFDQPAVHTLAPGVTRATTFDAADPAPFANSPVTLLVLDEVNTHFADVAYGVHSLQQFLLARPETLLQPTALLVVHDSRFEQLVPFTLDRDRLLAALKAHRPEQAWQLEQSMSAGEGVGVRLDLTLSALEQIVGYTARIPGHKNIVWVGAGFPSVDPGALSPATNLVLQHMLQHVTDVLLDARGTLFAIDPTTTAASVTEITDPVQLEFASAAGGGARLLDPFDRTLDFDRLGPVTGGRVIRGRNDIDLMVNSSIVLGSTYYTLGYHPTSNSQEAGKFRHIKVVCLRPGLVATTHDGYYTTLAPTNLATDTIGYDLNNAATASLPLNGILFTVEPHGPGDFVLHARAADLTWRQLPDSANTASVEVLVVALGAKNKILGHTLHNETATASTGVDTHAPDQRVRFTADLASPPKATRLRFVLRDTATGRMGTLDLPIQP